MAHVTYGFDLDLLGEVGPPPLPSLASYWRALPWSLHDFPNAAAFFLLMRDPLDSLRLGSCGRVRFACATDLQGTLAVHLSFCLSLDLNDFICAVVPCCY